MGDYYGCVNCGIIIFSFLLPDMLDGLLLIYDSVTADLNVNGFIDGIIVLNISTLAIVASFIYLIATGASNIILIKEVMVVILAFQIDRKVYSILQLIFPGWVDGVENCIRAKNKILRRETFSKECKVLYEKIEEVKRSLIDNETSVRRENNAKRSELQLKLGNGS